MRKKKQRKNNSQLIICSDNRISQERMIEIHAEAYYRALKRIENAKLYGVEKKHKKKEYTWYEKVFFALNVLLWPWKINKRFVINNRVYDSILVMFVSGTLEVVGSLLWLMGMLEIVCLIHQMLVIGIIDYMVNICCISIFSLLFGCAFILAGREFEKETDDNRIYAYSACIIALISCVVSIIALIKMY